jgi:hypothetical protein
VKQVSRPTFAAIEKNANLKNLSYSQRASQEQPAKSGCTKTPKLISYILNQDTDSDSIYDLLSSKDVKKPLKISGANEQYQNSYYVLYTDDINEKLKRFVLIIKLKMSPFESAIFNIFPTICSSLKFKLITQHGKMFKEYLIPPAERGPEKTSTGLDKSFGTEKLLVFSTLNKFFKDKKEFSKPLLFNKTLTIANFKDYKNSSHYLQNSYQRKNSELTRNSSTKVIAHELVRKSLSNSESLKQLKKANQDLKLLKTLML